MKITFLVPPSFDNERPAERSAGCTRVVVLAPNIYELTMAAVLEQDSRYDVKYRDFVYNGATPEQFNEFINGDNSDIYIIWGVNLSFDTDMNAIGCIRQAHPHTPVILLGPGPTYFTHKYLKHNDIIIVRGEPEATCAELIDHLYNRTDWSGIDGISYRGTDGNVVTNKPRKLINDLDSLPFPARHLVADHTFHNPKLKTGPYTTMFTSRNCPFHCIYCVPSSLSFAREIESRRATGHKPAIGFRTIASIEKEVAMLHEQGYKAIGFMDDNFIWNAERTRAICDIMRRYGMVWGCEARVDAITPEIARMLGESGCRYVDLGVESFDDSILEYVKKGITVADIYRAISELKKNKVPVKLNILIGSSPLETKQTVKKTLKEAKKLGVDQVMFNIVSPFPGTEYYKQCVDNGWLATPDYVPTDVQRHSILNLPSISAKEMEHLLFMNNLRFFLSPRFIIKHICRFKSWSEFTSALKSLKIKLFN